MPNSVPPGLRRRWDELIGGGAGSHGAGEGSPLPPVRRRVVFRPGAFRPIAAAVEYVQDRDLPVRQRVGDDVGRLQNHLRSEEHTSEIQSLMRISYAVFCLKKKN